MAVRIETQAEPIPGYRLLERLGGGGFGEVWKAEAPGGLLKAIKFVYGELHTANDDGHRAEQELKAMRRVQSVRHPYILSLERYDIVDDQLLIVMELADRNLWDRFKECRSQGLPGIPRDELLRYMDDTAEALDLMNNEYQLQHLDIKPQNLFLVHNHVKVADFGLVKDLEGMVASVTGGVTPVYAAPETFDGWVSRFSDQYSLAIVYQELLTGQRPFAGNNVRQLILQHLQAAPNLAPLPVGDRAAINRALAKNPEERHPNCQELARALRGSTAVVVPVTASTLEETGLLSEEDPADADTAKDPKPRPAGAGGPYPAASSIPPLPLPPTRTSTLPPPPTRSLRALTDTSAKIENAAALSTVQEVAGEGVLFPALVVGLGGLGLGVLKRLRATLHEEFGGLDSLPHLRLLYLDTDPDDFRSAGRGQAGSVLSNSEILLARLHRPSHYLKQRDGRVRIDTWFDPKMLYRIPRIQVTTGLRALGRLAFCDHYRNIVSRLKAELECCCNQETAIQAAQDTGLGLRTTRPRVYIVANLAGGTGSGMFLDFAYVARSLVKKLGYPQPDIVGLFFLPMPTHSPSRMLALGNAFAALTELNHFSAGHVFSARYQEREDTIRDAEPPFSRCTLVPLPESSEQGALESVFALGSEFLYHDLCAPLGRAVDDTRASFLSQPSTQAGIAANDNARSLTSPTCQPFGLYKFSFPRRLLVVHVGRQLCQMLVERWMSKDGVPVRDVVQTRLQEQWPRQEYGPERFIERLQDACGMQLQRAPEAIFAAMIAPVLEQREPDVASVKDALLRLQELLGRPEEDSLSNHTSLIEETLRKAAETILGEWGQRLAEVIVSLIEHPQFRLAGAEEAIRLMSAVIEQGLEHHEPLAQELANHTIQAQQRINVLLEQLNKGLNPKLRAAAQSELLELLNIYPKWRYQNLVLQQVARSFVSLRGLLSDQMREIGFCRLRLGELLRSFENHLKAESLAREKNPSVDPTLAAPGRYLFPGGCQNLDEAMAWLLNTVTPEQLSELDNRIQSMIRQQFTALVHVCLTSTNMLKNLEHAMHREAQVLISACLENMNVAALFLEQFPDEAAAQDAIIEAFEEAVPALASRRHSTDNEICLIAAPTGSAGDQFLGLVRNTLGDVNLQTVVSHNDILFYREIPRLQFADLEQFGTIGREAYQHMTTIEHFTPHTRADIAFISQ